MKINKDLLFDNKRIKAMYISPMKAEGFTIHNTGNGNISSARDEALNYYNNTWTKATPQNPGVIVHFTVDEDNVYQHIPINYHGWHASDGGNGFGNRKTIAIEIARDMDYSSDRYARAEARAAKLVAYLIKEFKVPKNIKRHHDYDPYKQSCPHRMFEGKPNSWNGFLKMVDKELGVKKPKPQSKPKPSKPNLDPRWVGLDMDTLVDQVIRGDWYDGQARVDSLKKYGYDPVAVQNAVNRKLGVGKPAKKKEKWLRIPTNITSYNYYRPEEAAYNKVAGKQWGILRPINYKHQAKYIEYKVIAQKGNFTTIQLHGNPKNPKIDIFTGPGTSHAWEIYYK